MVAIVASMNLLEQLDPFLLNNALLQYFFLRILPHKLAIEEDIMLASPDEAFQDHFIFICMDLRNGGVCEILDERDALVVCWSLKYCHNLRLGRWFIYTSPWSDRRDRKIMHKNSS